MASSAVLKLGFQRPNLFLCPAHPRLGCLQARLNITSDIILLVSVIMLQFYKTAELIEVSL